MISSKMKGTNQLKGRRTLKIVAAILIAKLCHFAWTEPDLYVTMTSESLNDQIPGKKNEPLTSKTSFDPQSAPVIGRSFKQTIKKEKADL